MTAMRGGVALKLLLGLLLFVVLAAGGIFWHEINRFADAPLATGQTSTPLEISRGSSFDAIVRHIRSRHLSAAPRFYWRVLGMRMGVTDTLHAGEYALPSHITPRQLLHNMAIGRVVQRNFTLVDGWTFRQVRGALSGASKLKHATQGMDDAAIMQRLGDAGTSPEGQFLPETYAYVRGDSDLDLLKRAHQAMQKTLRRLWAGRDADIPLSTPQQALILASLVEKETARADERARIAGVFERRLQKGMLLQTDPSVIYGMGKHYDGDITRSDLTTDTPYNTYMHAGLPPTPIAMPGRAAIKAVLHPASGASLYFVARGDGSGRHVFSDTLAEHNRAVDCYQRHHCAGGRH